MLRKKSNYSAPLRWRVARSVGRCEVRSHFRSDFDLFIKESVQCACACAVPDQPAMVAIDSFRDHHPL
jgi:hypothetical protein